MKRPILCIFIPFSAGIIFSHFFIVPLIYPLILSLVFTVLTVLTKKKAWTHIILYTAIFLLSTAYYRYSTVLPQDHISNFISGDPKKIFLKGTIIDDPVTSVTSYNTTRVSFTLNADSCKEDERWLKRSGLVKTDIYSDRGKLLACGDEVALEGLISRPSSPNNPGLFNHSKYLEIKNIYASLAVNDHFYIGRTGRNRAGLIKNTAYMIRHKIRLLFDRYLRLPYSGFLKAIIIGDRSEIDEGLKDDFIATGTVHIIVISGLHIALIGGIVMGFLGALRIPKKANLIFTLIFLIIYSFIAGSNPPVIRAAIIFSVLVIGKLIGRESDALNSLSIAAILILLKNPKELFDPSFQLSFASVAAIITFVPKINELSGVLSIKRKSVTEKLFFYVINSVSVSVSAWLGTWPFVATYFNMLSPISIIANLFVIPIIFLLTAVSFVFLFFSFISGGLAAIAAAALSVIARTLFSMTHIFAGIPFSHFRVPAPSLGLALCYYGLILLPFLRRWIRLRHGLCILLVLFNILAWKNVMPGGNGTLNITFLDVGQGDAIFMKLADGKNFLIDGGPGGKMGSGDMGRSVVAPYLWNRGVFTIDAVVVTHFHDDHLGGLIYMLKNFNVGCVIDSGTVSDSNTVYDEYLKTIKERGIRRLIVGEGDMLKPSGDIKIFVLNPEKTDDACDSNDNSIVLKVFHKDKSILLCADITQSAIMRLMRYGEFLRSSIIKVPHHGDHVGDGSVVGEFFKMVDPEISVISSGRVERYKRPSKITAGIIDSLNFKSYNTKEIGAIMIKN